MLKYVVTRTENALESMVIFTPHINHDDVAKSLPGTPVSAGFIKHGMVCGESATLNMKARPDYDQDHLRVMKIFLEDK